MFIVLTVRYGTRERLLFVYRLSCHIYNILQQWKQPLNSREALATAHFYAVCCKSCNNNAIVLWVNSGNLKFILPPAGVSLPRSFHREQLHAGQCRLWSVCWCRYLLGSTVWQQGQGVRKVRGKSAAMKNTPKKQYDILHWRENEKCGSVSGNRSKVPRFQTGLKRGYLFLSWNPHCGVRSFSSGLQFAYVKVQLTSFKISLEFQSFHRQRLDQATLCFCGCSLKNKTRTKKKKQSSLN